MKPSAKGEGSDTIQETPAANGAESQLPDENAELAARSAADASPNSVMEQEGEKWRACV